MTTTVIALTACWFCFALPSAAHAWKGTVDWPTFFRTGPGNHFVVLQELARGETADVQSCSDHWCFVQIGQVAGYVAQDSITNAADVTIFKAQKPADTCFDSRRAGYEKGEVFRYCAK